VPVSLDQHGWCELTTDDDIKVLHTLTGWSIDHNVPLEGLVATRPSLEDIYLSLVGVPAPNAETTAALEESTR
jgi:hypothetical protein